MQPYQQLLRILADNRFHSGEALGLQLNITRAGIWKLIKIIRAQGFEIIAIPNRGYQLQNPLSLLSIATIRSQLNTKIKYIDLFEEINSTNTYLLQHIYDHKKIPRVCIAELQHHGRARLGKTWFSPYGQNIYLSLLWRFDHSHLEFEALALVMSLSVIKALEPFNLPGILQVKWPNEVYLQGKKIAGILVERANEINCNNQFVIGIGLNVNIDTTKHAICSKHNWHSLFNATNQIHDRNKIAAMMIQSCSEYLNRFDEAGFKYFRTLWLQYDISYKKPLNLECHGLTYQGLSQGVDQFGRLIIASDKQHQQLFSTGNICK